MKLKIKRVKMKQAPSIVAGTIAPTHDGQDLEITEQKYGVLIYDVGRGNMSLIPWENVLEIQYDITDNSGTGEAG